MLSHTSWMSEQNIIVEREDSEELGSVIDENQSAGRNPFVIKLQESQPRNTLWRVAFNRQYYHRGGGGGMQQVSARLHII